MIGFTAKYKFDDNGIRAITSAVARLNAARVRVGVVGPDAEQTTPTGGNLKLWELAAIQEFGTKDGHIPERSFIRRTLNDLVWVRAIAARAAERVVMKGESADAALNWMGNVVASAIRNTIMQSVPPPNAESTVDWKGHDHTLIGLTMTLLNAIGHEVVSGSTDVSVFTDED